MSRFVAFFLIVLALPPRAPSQARSADERQIIAIEEQWVDAEVKHDEVVLNQVLDDDFMLISASGITTGRAAFIERVRKFTYTAIKVVHERIEIKGDTAIVIATVSTRSASGAANAPLRFTVTYIKRNGVWRALAEHASSIAAPKIE